MRKDMARAVASIQDEAHLVRWLAIVAVAVKDLKLMMRRRDGSK